MKTSWLYRSFFVVLSCFMAVAYQYSAVESDPLVISVIVGMGKGLVLFMLFFAVEIAMRRMTLRLLNTIILGLFTGTLLGYAITTIVTNAYALLSFEPSVGIHHFLLTTIYLGSIYLSMMLIASTQENFWLSIPFVKFTPGAMAKKKDIIVDLTALEDPRLLELARNNLLNYQLVIPTFVIKELQKGLDSPDDAVRSKSRKCQEHLKRLEAMDHLGLQQKEFHFFEQEEFASKIIHATRILQGYLITADHTPYRQDEEGLVIINLENIAGSMKPGAQRGEILSIKIQRPGKEPKQGVGYLDDGTMVVVNGGGEFLGQQIRTQVLSQKYSSSGKIIFCNALVDEKSVKTPYSEMPSYQFSYSGNNAQ